MEYKLFFDQIWCQKSVEKFADMWYTYQVTDWFVWEVTGFVEKILKDDINTRVFEALGRAGIEIPYPYTSVILQKTDLEEEKRDLQDESDWIRGGRNYEK